MLLRPTEALCGRLREDAPPAAPARARTAAALHRTEWRLRDVVPAPAADPSDLRFRRDRTARPDGRTHTFAKRPAVPRSARRMPARPGELLEPSPRV